MVNIGCKKLIKNIITIYDGICKLFIQIKIKQNLIKNNKNSNDKKGKEHDNKITLITGILWDNIKELNKISLNNKIIISTNIFCFFVLTVL